MSNRAGRRCATYNLPGIRSCASARRAGDISSHRSRSGTTIASRALNAEASLPDQPSSSCTDRDGSGTTYIWVDYTHDRSARSGSSRWAAAPRSSGRVGLGGKGNEGVAGEIQEHARGHSARRAGVRHHQQAARGLGQERVGQVHRTHDREYRPAADGRAAAKSYARRFPRIAHECAGADAYPIASFTWLLVYREQCRRSQGPAAREVSCGGRPHDGQKHARTALRTAARPGRQADRGEDQARSPYQGKPLLARADMTSSFWPRVRSRSRPAAWAIVYSGVSFARRRRIRRAHGGAGGHRSWWLRSGVPGLRVAVTSSARLESGRLASARCRFFHVTARSCRRRSRCCSTVRSASVPPSISPSSRPSGSARHRVPHRAAGRRSERRVRLWGIFVLAPWLRTWVQPALGAGLASCRCSRGRRTASGMLAAGIILDDHDGAVHRDR